MPLIQVKGNVYKNKRVLMEAIHHMKAEKLREKTIADQLEARRAKNKVTRVAKLARREERLNAVRTLPDCLCFCSPLHAQPLSSEQQLPL